MANKIFGIKNITHLLYGIIVLLPMFAILGRVIYTQSNVNAYQSYSNQMVETAIKFTNANKSTYFVNNQLITYLDDGRSYGSASVKLYFHDISVDLNNLLNTDNVNYVAFSFYTSSSGWLQFYDSSDTSYRLNNFRNYFNSFTYSAWIDETHPASINIDTYGVWYAYTYKTSSLDNAFEYSLKTFTDDNNLGEVDMFSWFTDLFLDHSNAHNQIYIGFVNWYLNYTMLVSCGYLFFLVLIWFINFIRRILDKSMYQDYGGF